MSMPKHLLRFSNQPRLVAKIYARRDCRGILLTGSVEHSASLWLHDLIIEKSKFFLALLWFQQRFGYRAIAGLQFEFLLPLVARVYRQLKIPARRLPGRLMQHPVKFRNKIEYVISQNKSWPAQAVNYVSPGQLVSQEMTPPIVYQRKALSTPSGGFQHEPMRPWIHTGKERIASRWQPDDRPLARNLLLRDLSKEQGTTESSLFIANYPTISKIALPQRRYTTPQDRAFNSIQARNAKSSAPQDLAFNSLQAWYAKSSAERYRIINTKLNRRTPAVIENPVRLNFSSSPAYQFKVLTDDQPAGRSHRLVYPHLSSPQKKDMTALTYFHPTHQTIQEQKAGGFYPQSDGFVRGWPISRKIDAPWKRKEELGIFTGVTSKLMLENLKRSKISSEELNSKQRSPEILQETKSLFVDHEINYIHHHPVRVGSFNRSPAENTGSSTDQSQRFEKSTPELMPSISTETVAQTFELAKPAGITRRQMDSTIPINDINTVADEIFSVLEKKMRTERQRRGIFS